MNWSEGVAWWEDQVFDYVYADGSSISYDEPWHNELIYISQAFKEFGLKWCIDGQHWVKGSCRCNY